MHRVATISISCFLASLTAAAAAPSVGLVGDKTLVFFDTDARSVTETKEVSGIDRLLGIDVRSSNGALIGVTADFTVVEIDPSTGAAKTISTMDTPLPADGQSVVVDFNPAADKLRFMAGGVNHRVDVDTGKVTVDGALAFEAGDMHAGEKPSVVAAAYTNSNGKPEKTAMYDIDATIVALIRQTSPNEGKLAAVGKLDLSNPASNFAFDIQTDPDMTNTAWLINGSTLYTVDLETGKATMTGEVSNAGGEIRDLAVLPRS